MIDIQKIEEAQKAMQPVREPVETRFPVELDGVVITVEIGRSMHYLFHEITPNLRVAAFVQDVTGNDTQRVTDRCQEIANVVNAYRASEARQ